MQQEGSRAPAAGQPPEQISVGSGAEGSCQAPDVLARARGWFKPGRLKLAAVSNSAVDSLVSYKTPVPRGLYLSEDAAHMSPVQGWPV